jgi:simple sugar transport system permease protein
MTRILTDHHLRFLLIANVLILIIATILSGGTFLDPYNFQSMATQLPEIGLLAIAIMITMISGNGGIDLSVISIANLSVIVAALLCKNFFPATDTDTTQSWLFSGLFVIIALGVGTLCGVLNGLLVARASYAPILATLGTQLLFLGIATVLTGGPAIIIGGIEPLSQIGNGTILNIPIPFLIFLSITTLFSLLLSRTRFGFRLYLTGSNAKAAHFAGIHTSSIALVTYTLAGLLAALSGIISSTRSASAKADFGVSYLLIAILIAVMGGVNPSGGYGKILGLVLAGIALQMLSSMLSFIGANDFLKDFMWGLLLLISIVLTGSSLFRPRKIIGARRAYGKHPQ